jgi:hypothetical protein
MKNAKGKNYSFCLFAFKEDLESDADREFLDGTSPRIYPWNQSQIENLKSSSPRIYPWG